MNNTKTGIIGYTTDDPPREILRLDPDDRLDFAVNWKMTASDPFDEPKCTVTPQTTGIQVDGTFVTGTRQIAWLVSTGELGEHPVLFHVETAGERRKDKTIVIRVSEH